MLGQTDKECIEIDGLLAKIEFDSFLPLSAGIASGTRLFTMALSPDGRFLVIGDEGSNLHVWDTFNRELFEVYRGFDAAVESVQFTLDSRYIIAGFDDGHLATWRVGEAEPVLVRDTGSRKGIYAMVLTRDGKEIITGDLSSTISIWRVDDLCLENRLHSPGHGVLSLEYIEEQSILISGNVNGSLNFFDLDAKGLLSSMRSHVGPVFSLDSCLDNGLIISSGADGLIRILDANDQSPVFTLKTGSAKVMDTILLDGYQKAGGILDIISAGGDGTMKVFGIDLLGKESCFYQTIHAHGRTVEKIIFNNFDECLYSISSDGTAKKWHLIFERFEDGIGKC
ncbi:MAG: WD40 repeat domain-containing protein [Promethearchaeota archaeon]